MNDNNSWLVKKRFDKGEKERESEKEGKRETEIERCKQLGRSYKVVFAKFVSLVRAAESSRKIVPEKNLTKQFD